MRGRPKKKVQAKSSLRNKETSQKEKKEQLTVKENRGEKGKPVQKSSKARVAKKSRDAATPAKEKPKAKFASSAKVVKPKSPAVGLGKPLTSLEPSNQRSGGVTVKFLMGLAQAIKDAIAPLARSVKGREIVHESISGDVTFQLDRVAEKTLQTYLRAANVPLSYYSEDEGYSTFTSKQPKHLLIVDPIDGSRAAKSGFEGCVISVASTRVLERPTVADVDCACVMEILGDRTFIAERGKGARYYQDGHLKRPKLSQNADLETLTWSMTIPARPAELIFPTAARIIDLSSLKGGFFACNSTSYSLTRLITNQLDACVDVANRYYRDIPERVEDYFINAGRGKTIGIAPYDMAAALLIVQEAGCIVTDAYGNKFDDLLLLDSSKNNHRSIIAASNMKLHEKLLSFFDARIRQYEALLTRQKG